MTGVRTKSSKRAFDELGEKCGMVLGVQRSAVSNAVKDWGKRNERLTMMLIVTFVLSRRGLVTRSASRELERWDPKLEKSERNRRSREFRNFHLDL